MDAITVEEYVETFGDMPHVSSPLKLEPCRSGTDLSNRAGWLLGMYLDNNCFLD